MNRRLDSWKAIAEYLGRDQATVRRWEKTLGLPVRRVGGAGRSVFAFTDDVDAWLASPKAPSGDMPSADPPLQKETAPAAAPAPRRRAWVAVTASLAVAVAVAVGWAGLGRAAAMPSRMVMSERGFVALDARGGEIWRYDYPAHMRGSYPSFEAASVVVEGSDPAVYVATSSRVHDLDGRAEGGELIGFSADGRRERTFAFDDTIALHGATYTAPWAVTGFAVAPPDARAQVAIAAHHFVWSPSLVAVLDHDLKRAGTFVNDGWIETLSWLGPRRLALGGFLQERDAGLAIMLDTETMTPVKMVTMPRSELNVVTGSRFNRAIIQVLADRVVARTIEVPQEASEGAVDAVYEFTRDFDLVRANFGSRYWEVHRALEAQGKLRHTAAECPDRNGPREVFVWEPSRGWHAQPIVNPL